MTQISDPKLQLAKTTITAELSKTGLNYQKILQAAEDIRFTEETINQDYAPLKDLRDCIKQAERIIESEKKPAYDAYKVKLDAGKGVLDPLKEVLVRKTNEFTLMAEKLKRKLEAEAAEKKRKDDLQAAIANFVLDYSQKVAAATTAKELVDIERMINLEATRSGRYQEFTDEFKGAIISIRGLITNQKKDIKEVVELDKKIATALASEDDATAIELMNKKETIEAEIIHNKTVVQEDAVNTFTSVVPQAEVVTASAPKARLTTWNYELVDAVKALRDAPEMVEVTIKAGEARAKLAIIKTELIEKGLKEITISGIRYYQESKY